MPTFTFRCPNPKCRQVLAIPESLRGLRVRCANCGQSFPAPLLSLRYLLSNPPVDEQRRKAG